LYLTCLAGIGAIDAYVWYEVMYFPLRCVLGLVAYVLVAYLKVFQFQKVFSKFLRGSFGIGLFVSSDTYKGKAAYIWISPDPT